MTHFKHHFTLSLKSVSMGQLIEWLTEQDWADEDAFEFKCSEPVWEQANFFGHPSMVLKVPAQLHAYTNDDKLALLFKLAWGGAQ